MSKPDDVVTGAVPAPVPPGDTLSPPIVAYAGPMPASPPPMQPWVPVPWPSPAPPSPIPSLPSPDVIALPRDEYTALLEIVLRLAAEPKSKEEFACLVALAKAWRAGNIPPQGEGK